MKPKKISDLKTQDTTSQQPLSVAPLTVRVGVDTYAVIGLVPQLHIFFDSPDQISVYVGLRKTQKLEVVKLDSV